MRVLVLTDNPPPRPRPHTPSRTGTRTTWPDVARQTDCKERLRRAHVEQEPLRRSQEGRKCVELAKTFGVVPGVSWGRMEEREEQKHSWTSLRCDCYFDRACKDRVFKTRPPALHASTSAAGKHLPAPTRARQPVRQRACACARAPVCIQGEGGAVAHMRGMLGGGK